MNTQVVLTQTDERTRGHGTAEQGALASMEVAW